MSQRAATEEVAAERLVVTVVEQIRYVGAGCDVARDPIAGVDIEDAVARNRTGIRPREPGEPVHPAVPQRAADRIPVVRHPGAELMALPHWLEIRRCRHYVVVLSNPQVRPVVDEITPECRQG